MALDLADYEKKTKDAVKAFWGNRDKATKKQIEVGKLDQGERSGVTGGKNLDGFIALILDLVKANGLGHADIHQSRALVTLPGAAEVNTSTVVPVLTAGRFTDAGQSG